MSADLLLARSQQLAGLLLSTMPVAERMLLYNMALAAWIMLPERTLLQKSLQRTRHWWDVKSSLKGTVTN